MAFIPAANTAKVAAIFNLNGEELVNTLYFRSSNPPITPVALQDLGGRLALWWTNNRRQSIPNSMELQRFEITDLSVANSFQHIQNVAENGLRAGTLLPNQVALAISFRTGLSGRVHRGRNYAMGLVEGDVVDNLVQPAFASPVQGAYQALLPGGSLDLGSWEWVVASFRINKAPRLDAEVTPIVSAIYTSLMVSTQRRRIPKR